MTTQKQQGFSALIIVLLIALVGVIGFVGWRMYDAGQQSSQQATQNTNQQTQQPATDPNEGYVVIKEWGVRFKPVEGFNDVQYFKPKDVAFDAISITSEGLGKIEPGCSTSSDSMAFGLITRSVDPDAVSGGVIAKINNYNFQWRVSGASCGTLENRDLINKVSTQINESIKSLEAAK